VLPDLRLAWRALRRAPTFAVTAILTLAIGIGGSTAIFSVVNAVLWRPLPFHEPSQLVRLWESHAATGRTRVGVAALTAGDWLARSTTLEDIALFDAVPEPVVIEAAQARQAIVTPNFFALLGVRAAEGRTFMGSEPGQTAGREVILSHEFWQRAFDADRGIVGRTVSLEGRAGGVVVGVLPPEFSFPPGIEVWTTVSPRKADRSSRDYGAIGRVKAGIDAARVDLQSVAVGLARDFPATNDGWTVDVVPLLDSVAGPHRLGLLTLLAAIAFVMLVGCANLSNLLLARGMARQNEFAVRAALGASRAQVARLLLTEATLIALIGGAAGWFIAGAMLPVLLQLADESIPRLADARLNAPVLAYCTAAAGVSALLAGLVPALRLSHTDLQATMRPSSERVTRSGANARLQRVIVAAELAACLVLVLGALLFTQTFVRLNDRALGFDPTQVISIDARMPLYRSVDPSRWQRLSADAIATLERLRAVPGVDAVSATSDPPLTGTGLTADLTFPGETRVGQALYHRVSPGYFRTLGMTIVQGRDFTNADASDLALLPDPRAGKPRPGAVIINETTARTYWPNGNALGQFLSTSFDMRVISRREVVGVVRDIVSAGRREPAPVEVYIPYLEDPSFAMTLLVRTALPPDQIVQVLRREIHAVASDLSVANVRTLDEVVQQSMAAPRFGAVLVSAFAAAALLLAAVGVYGVCAFGISTRVREIGIRLALGATRRDIVLLFLKEAAGPVALGLAAGVLGALALSRLVAALLFGVSATDLASFATAIVVLVIVAFTASYLPVRLALRSDAKFDV
jgi:putative ABC transport system permease protein